MPEKEIGKGTIRSVQLGELVTTVFDHVAELSNDPKELSRIAVKIVVYILRHTQRSTSTWPRVETKFRIQSESADRRFNAFC